MSSPRTGAELGMSMQSAGGGTMASQAGNASGSAMGGAEVASKGGQLDDTGMSKPQDKGTAKGMKAMKK